MRSMEEEVEVGGPRDDFLSEDDHSPTDASEDSVEVRVKPIRAPPRPPTPPAHPKFHKFRKHYSALRQEYAARASPEAASPPSPAAPPRPSPPASPRGVLCGRGAALPGDPRRRPAVAGSPPSRGGCATILPTSAPTAPDAPRAAKVPRADPAPDAADRSTPSSPSPGAPPPAGPAPAAGPPGPPSHGRLPATACPAPRLAPRGRPVGVPAGGDAPWVGGAHSRPDPSPLPHAAASPLPFASPCPTSPPPPSLAAAQVAPRGPLPHRGPPSPRSAAAAPPREAPEAEEESGGSGGVGGGGRRRRRRWRSGKRGPLQGRRRRACRRLLQPGKHKQRNYKNMTRERRIEANARERNRVHTISAAFEKLRSSVPAYSHNQKLSKLSMLRIACTYILSLSRLAGHDYSEGATQPSFSECVDLTTRTIQVEGKAKKKRDE
ncbi:LOW QUALITY PROTEIN: transcription factor ATOH8-like [Scylla paramamosain]|uniref:LOW QUALITY PROTEIN: transcription factor ATOH8-like n=1 Tax=Scylla paramamosain TaxID=85552 RepID=UPI0030837F3F